MASRGFSPVLPALATAAWGALLFFGLRLPSGGGSPATAPPGWKETTVQVSRVVPRGDMREVHFSYQVDGRRYTGVAHRAADEAGGYAAGRSAPAAYLPGNPGSAILTAPPASGTTRLLLAVFLVGTGVLLVIFPWAAWWRRRG